MEKLAISTQLNTELKICLASSEHPIHKFADIACAFDKHGHSNMYAKMNRIAQFCVEALTPPPLPSQRKNPVDNNFLRDVDDALEFIDKPRPNASLEDDIPVLPDRYVKYDPDYLKKMRSDKMRQMNEERRRKKLDDEARMKLRRYLQEPLDYAMKWWDEDKYLSDEERKKREMESIPTLKQRDLRYDPEYLRQMRRQKMLELNEKKKRERVQEVEPENIFPVEEPPELPLKEVVRLTPPPLPKRSELINKLIVIADKYDQQGKFKVADKIDSFILSFAAKSGKVKKMDDDLKKDLLKFFHNAEKHMEIALEDVEELQRRLRYYDLSDHIKEMALDKSTKDMKNLFDVLSEKKKRMYELSYGKKPSKEDLAQLASDFDGDSANDSPRHNPIDFFELNFSSEKDVEEDISEEELLNFFE